MEQNKKNKYFWFDYDDIWSFLESVFGMEDEQIEEVLSYWLEETLKLEGYTPESSILTYTFPLEETLKIKGYILNNTEIGVIKK